MLGSLSLKPIETDWDAYSGKTRQEWIHEGYLEMQALYLQLYTFN